MTVHQRTNPSNPLNNTQAYNEKAKIKTIENCRGVHCTSAHRRNSTRKLQNTGITLIALIITIIILLILAGVTINFVLGENGIINKTTQVKEQYNMQTAKEKIELAIAEYEIKMRTETIYSMLNKVEGLESIEPNYSEAGIPYVVIVDGYEFLVKEGIEVIYQGKGDGIIPEITKFEKEVVGEKVKIKIETKTKDKEGIQEIRLIKNGIEIETKTVNGEEIVEEFNITSNGNYRIKVIGKNKKQKTSNEIKVEELETLSGTIQAGTVINGGVTLTINATSEKSKISKLEIYNGTNKLEEIRCGESTVCKEYKIEYMPFWASYECYAKIIEDSGMSANTNTQQVKNADTIKTANDLKKFIDVVNNGEDFSQKKIKQIDNIDLANSATVAIGTGENSFRGTYDGQTNRITNLNITSTKPIQGLFGYIENATIKNITLGTGTVRGENRVGAAVGYAYESSLENITNEGIIVEATNQYTQTVSSYNYMLNNISESSTVGVVVGGICGKSESTYISNCNNKKDITISNQIIGGIVGISCGDNVKTIEQCTNFGNISGNQGVGGIIGVAIEKPINKNGEIIPNVNKCVNNGNITSQTCGGGIIGWNYGLSTGDEFYLIAKCANNGNITVKNSYVSNHWWQGQIHELTDSCGGGIIGWSVKTKILECDNSGIVKNTCTKCGDGIGGIAGFIGVSEISKCSNVGEIDGGSIGSSAGGILGFGCKNISINECYNKNKVKGYTSIGGIAGWVVQGNIRNCYNAGEIEGITISGISSWLGEYDTNSYTNNYLYNCYNIGNIVSSLDNVGICAYTKYYDVDYLYSLTGKASSIWGSTYTNNKNGKNTGIVDADTLKSTVASWDGFELDRNNINDGYPVLSWQNQAHEEE